MKKKEKPGWREVPDGGLIVQAGNSEKYRTGSWRIRKPLYSAEKCIQCMLCWAYCPDMAIKVEDGDVVGVDYLHCKGCGICANQCPVEALEMVDEDDFDIDDKLEKDERDSTGGDD